MKTRMFMGILLILIGLGALTGISFTKYFLALVFIVIGVRMLTGSRSSRRLNLPVTETTETYINDVAVFTALKKKYTGSRFTGGKLVVIFAGGEIDLSRVKTEGKPVDLELVCVFGGLKLSVPESWAVRTEAVAVIGGLDNKTKSGGKTEVRIRGASVFGGIEIVN